MPASHKRERHGPRRDNNSPLARWAAYWPWCYLSWLAITWDKSAEQIVFGAVASVIVAAALTPLGPALQPWLLLDPRRWWVLLRTAVYVLAHLAAANVSLARRIWSPSRPLKPGMVIVPTQARSDGELTALAMLTSLIVDNQIVDLDRRSHQLQYHAVWCGSPKPQDNRAKINGPLERLLARLRTS